MIELGQIIFLGSMVGSAVGLVATVALVKILKVMARWLDKIEGR